MKYLKRFKTYNETNFNEIKIDVLNAGPGNIDGGVQIDTVIISSNDVEYEFEVATMLNGDMCVTYIGQEEDDFTDNFELRPETELEDSEFKDFLCDGEVGDTIEFDNYEIEIMDFSHSGGMEFGFIEVSINDVNFIFDIIQDATGNNLECDVEFSTQGDKEKLDDLGIILDDNLKSYLISQYDKTCSSKR